MKESNDIFTSNILAAKRDLLKYWYLIAISLVIAIGFAMVYIKFSAKTYKVGSSILLRIEKNQNFGGGSDDILKAFDFMIQDKSFQNEIHFIQSLPLIREVVDDMNMRVSYYIQEDKIPTRFKFSRKNLYKDSPIIVIPNEDHPQPINIDFHLRIVNDEHFIISASGEGVSLMDYSNGQIVRSVPNYQIDGAHRFGNLIETDNSSFTIVLNSNFNPENFRGKDLFFRFNHLNHLASYFKGSLSVNAKGIESTMAEISFTTENYRLGTDFLSTLIEKYIEHNAEEANIMANKTIEHIDRQLVDVSDDLSSSEQQLQNIRSSQNIMNIEEKAQNIYNQLSESRNRRDETQRRLNHLEQLNDHFIQYKDSSRILAPSSLGLTDPLLNNLIQELTTLNSEKQRIISQDQIRNPRLQTINISIETLKNAIEDNLGFTLNTTRRELNTLNSKINELNTEFANYQVHKESFSALKGGLT
jgi:tyrosine-protein kinase Etk/Wzc